MRSISVPCSPKSFPARARAASRSRRPASDWRRSRLVAVASVVTVATVVAAFMLGRRRGRHRRRGGRGCIVLVVALVVIVARSAGRDGRAALAALQLQVDRRPDKARLQLE